MNPSRPTPSRRHFLQALGLTAGSLFLPSRGLANVGAPATRILFFVTGHGTVYDNWRMRPTGEPEDADWTFSGLSGLAPSDWSPILAPLQPYASKLSILDGLAYGPSILAATNEHDEGHATCLTGANVVPLDGAIGIADGPSLDQIIGATKSTPFRTLEYTLRYGWSPCFDASGQRIPMEGESREAWLRLFGGVGGSSSPLTSAERVAARQGSVLDAAANRFDWLLPRLGAEDRAKLETHRDLIRDLEAQIGAVSGLTCTDPGEPEHGDYWYDSVAGLNAWFDLSTAALACGLTDVITIRAGDIDNAEIGAPPGDLHNDYAHNTHLDAGAASIMTDYHTWYAQRFAELLARLDSIPEGNGTLLDNTIVVWTNELATGHHTHTDVPIVLAGGTNALATNQIVRWAPTHEITGPWEAELMGTPHNRLLVTLAQAMGLSIDQVGRADLPLATGGSLDCTGVLPRLCL